MRALGKRNAHVDEFKFTSTSKNTNASVPSTAAMNNHTLCQRAYGDEDEVESEFERRTRLCSCRRAVREERPEREEEEETLFDQEEGRACVLV
jgi:hypothetical protein